MHYLLLRAYEERMVFCACWHLEQYNMVMGIFWVKITRKWLSVKCCKSHLER